MVNIKILHVAVFIEVIIFDFNAVISLRIFSMYIFVCTYAYIMIITMPVDVEFLVDHVFNMLSKWKCEITRKCFRILAFKNWSTAAYRDNG